MFASLQHMFKAVIKAWILGVLIGSSGCAYHFGNRERALPGGYDLVAVPMFVNKTHETGIEVYFTNSLRQQFEHSRVARVLPKSEAQVTVLGTVDSVSYTPTSVITPTTGSNALPTDTSLATAYRVVIEASVQVVRNSDRKVLWSGLFTSETNYSAPQVTQPTLNTVNPLYNQSARDYNIAKLAKDMMSEAHDRITENF